MRRGGAATGDRDEGIGIGEEDLPELQDHPAQRRGAGDLHRSAAQATAGVTAAGGQLSAFSCQLSANCSARISNGFADS
jgi:hypothetical protein